MRENFATRFMVLGSADVQDAYWGNLSKAGTVIEFTGLLKTPTTIRSDFIFHPISVKKLNKNIM